MTPVTDIVRSATLEPCRPWPRHVLSHADWINLALVSIAGSCSLLAHWADTSEAHALFLEPGAMAIVAVSTAVENGRYPALSPVFSGATCYERMIHDLWGHRADGAKDLRPWLDHGAWPQVPPMAMRPGARTTAEPPTLPESGQRGVMVLPLGPVWGRLEEAAHLRLTLHGPLIRRAEVRLGFSHKGTLTLMRGKSPRTAARFAARLAADATVAHSVAFAQAAESAMDVVPPARATMLRIVMMEIERIAGHLDNLAEVSRLADAAVLHTSCGVSRENLLRASEATFGHRLMMDCVVPGGVATDIAADGSQAILRVLDDITCQLARIRRLHGAPALSTRLAGLGCASATQVAALAAGGVVGRASGRAFDVRTAFSPGYGPLAPHLAPGLTTRTPGDAAARQSLRISEIEQSLRLIDAALGNLPDGPVGITLPQVSGEGIACAESVRGDVWHWLRLDHGQIAAAFVRDPGWALWPVAELVLANAHAEDADLIRASFALPSSGMDL